MKLPDVGEGVAEAELVSWLVAVGDEVTPDSVLAEVLTDKATVEVSSPTTGVVTVLHGEPGDVLAIGTDLVEIETGGASSSPAPERDASEPPAPAPNTEEVSPAPSGDATASLPRSGTGEAPSTDDEPDLTTMPAAGHDRPTAAPAVRARARALGIELGTVSGSGPDGRVVHADLDRAITCGRSATRTHTDVTDEGRAEPVRGVRRRIADRLTAAWTEIPHITYVEAVDVTELERLRGELNTSSEAHGDVRLTILAFVTRAAAIACVEQPRLNAHYHHSELTLTTFEAVHIGIATQTDEGLLVPVVRRVETRGIWDLAAELARVAAAARDGSATREQLLGSTITITSLGALGGLVTTPILNPPEVAIVGVNKMEIRPVWRNGVFEPRQMLNLSSSFDHRIVDGWDAAKFVQRVRSLLETPALLFIDDP
jgi:2-oxoisovalerate dehydrogenase E2 component (dihydrolipoyl transacylase)